MLHPLLDELDSSLARIVPREPVELSGEWSSAIRRVYRSSAQQGSGSGPFVEVVDLRWRGGLSCRVPIAGLLILVTPTDLYWAKSAPASPTQPVEVSLHAYRDSSPDRATFAASLGGVAAPGVPVACGVELADVATLGTATQSTGRVECLTRAADVAFMVVLLPGESIKVGRNRLWHLRADLAASLPPHLGELLTRRRTGRASRVDR